MANLIRYGDGQVDLDYGGNVLAFDIELRGKCNISTNLPSSWVVSSNKNFTRIIGVAFGQSIPGNSNIFNYTGKIDISRCIIVGDDNELHGLNIADSKDTYYPRKSDLVFSTSNDKYDELKIKEDSLPLQSKQHFIHQNLLTKHNEYYYKDGGPVPEGTDYHIHLNTDQAMTKPTHQSDSVNIYKKMNNGKLFEVKKIVRRKPKKLPKKAAALVAEKIKKSTSAGTVAPRTGADKNVSGGEDPSYSGGGSD
tara:strand:- start:590 stop:1342 length:753 start_codon:yes stop_codon:yes gene_type:complete